MDFLPRIPKTNVNIPQESHLKEFVVLLFGIGVAVLLLYLALGFVVDRIVSHAPESVDEALRGAFDSMFSEAEGTGSIQKELQGIVDTLAEHVGSTEGSYSVIIVDNELPNAFAVPGSKIIVTTGLLAQAQSENEIVMILGHEIGHHVHRDVVRGFGRGIVLLAISSFVLGDDSSASQFLTRWLLASHLSFSRSQESRADTVGLRLLNAYYGHVGGATDFFDRISGTYERGQWTDFFSTHPLSKKRVEKIHALAQSSKFPERGTRENRFQKLFQRRIAAEKK